MKKVARKSGKSLPPAPDKILGSSARSAGPSRGSLLCQHAPHSAQHKAVVASSFSTERLTQAAHVARHVIIECALAQVVGDTGGANAANRESARLTIKFIFNSLKNESTQRRTTRPPGSKLQAQAQESVSITAVHRGQHQRGASKLQRGSFGQAPIKSTCRAQHSQISGSGPRKKCCC